MRNLAVVLLAAVACGGPVEDRAASDNLGASRLRIVAANLAGGDTVIRLYDSSQREIANDDDSGAGYYSLLRRTLGPGVYSVRVTSYAGWSVIPGYTLRVSTY